MSGRLPLDGGVDEAGARSAVRLVRARTSAGPKSSFYAIAEVDRAGRRISSADGGATWSASQTITSGMSSTWAANTSQGRMVGDYISTSFGSDGLAHGVLTRLGLTCDGEPARQADHGPGDGAKRQLVVDDQYRDRPRRAVGSTHFVLHARMASRSNPGWSPALRSGASPPAPRGTAARP